jgi:hypothetical protein
LRFCESLLWQGPGSWVVCDWMQFLDLEESLRMAYQLCFCTDMLSRNYELFWAFYFWCWIVFSCVTLSSVLAVMMHILGLLLWFKDQ